MILELRHRAAAIGVAVLAMALAMATDDRQQAHAAANSHVYVDVAGLIWSYPLKDLYNDAARFLRLDRAR